MPNDIVDFLISNKAFLLDVMEKVASRQNSANVLFQDELEEQKLTETKREIVDEVCRSLGCTIEDFNDTIADKALDTYLKHLEKI